MKLPTYLIWLFYAMAMSHSSMHAEEEGEYDVIIKTGIITELDYDAYENLYSFKLDHTSRWEMEYFDFKVFNWEVGDPIKIYYQNHIYDHFAENLDKYNNAYLIKH